MDWNRDIINKKADAEFSQIVRQIVQTLSPLIKNEIPGLESYLVEQSNVNSIPRTLRYTGSFGVRSNFDEIHINYPAQLDTDDIHNKVLETIEIVLNDHPGGYVILKDVLGFSNRVIEIKVINNND